MKNSRNIINKIVRRHSKRRGAALITSFGIMVVLSIAASSYIDSATMATRTSKRQTQEVQTTQLCEAGVQTVMNSLWEPFRDAHRFDDLEEECEHASVANPEMSVLGSIPGVGRFSAGVVSFTKPGSNSYVRRVKVRAVGWIDSDGDAALDAGEPRKIVDSTIDLELERAKVFDYVYFVNNYGWMTGFHENDLIINGDMRANGDFSFSSGMPTVNGQVIACENNKLVPAAAGTITGTPVKWGNDTYATKASGDSRMRPGYSSGVFGERSSETFEQWADLIFDSSTSVKDSKAYGSYLYDVTGMNSWTRSSEGGSPSLSLVDSQGAKELMMPDLQNLSYYTEMSDDYTDQKATFADGTANPNYGQEAYVEVWNSSTNSYQRITDDGILNGSAILVGSSSKPIKVHGPVTFTEDVVIKGYIQGQGTVYAGRNVHIIGSVIYKDPPSWSGGSASSADQSNSKKDLVALCARGSVMMGSPKGFSNPYPLKYMTPPFTKGRYDNNGNFIPAFDALAADGVDVNGNAIKKYQSRFGDDALDAIKSDVTQIDAILYTNFVGGGNIGTNGGGVDFNGAIISKDEAMVVWSLPIVMNYDNRIKERSLTNKPLIDISLPRSPSVKRMGWQDQGFGGGH